MTLHELEDNQRRILPLFPSADHHLAIESVIEGNCEGSILVNDVATPKTAVVWAATESEALLFVAGATDDSSFNEALKTYLTEKIKPESVERGADAFHIYPDRNWEKVLQKVFKDENLIKDRDSYYRLNPYTFHKLQPDWRKRIPDGFTLKRAETEEVFEKNVPVFQGISPWKSFEEFKKHGFAYYLEEDAGDIVSGCKTELAVKRGCALGIGTVEQWRKRGFATLTACAVVTEALERGLEVIWECYHGNVASMKTNQKVGFEYICDEYFHVGFLFESLQNDFYLGYYYLVELDNPQESVHWFEKAITLSEKEKKPISAGRNMNAACAFARVGKCGQALERLDAIIDGGLPDPRQFCDQLKNERAFDTLRGLPDFDKVLERVENLLKE